MGQRSRRYGLSRGVVDRTGVHGLQEALELLKTMAPARFDETVECSVQLGIDPRHSDQQVRGSISLPHGTGQARTVAVFAEGEAADAARQAGADHVGGDELIQQVQDGFMDFDVALATPSMMSRIGRLGRVLGPRGLMPSPKSGTVREDVGKAVGEFKAGRIEFRNDSGGNVHVPVGKLSFSVADLVQNVQALIEQLVRMKPPASKGKYLRKVYVCSTMNPAVQVELE
ncbi:MAG: 50S ribosomal protein L1 [Planctomycetes bacterium SM23_32]|nr:MAG: 50S ribosomal protein L1 [Planctomycetes bacterium SM23_32]